MICIETTELGSVTIMGHALTFQSFFCDLRLPNALERLKIQVIKEHKDKEDMINAYIGAVGEIINKHPSDWGDNEEERDYLTGLSDGDWHLRALVALNGKHPEKTSKDPVVAVRVCTVQSLLNDRTRNADRSDVDWLDAMIDDESWSVREMVALYGKREHLDTLVNDKNGCVRMAVGTHGIKEHLDILANDENPNVRQIVRQSGDEKHQELVALKELSEMEVSTLKS